MGQPYDSQSVWLLKTCVFRGLLPVRTEVREGLQTAT